MANNEENGKTIKIGFVSILSLAAIILGFFFVAIMNHESRISKSEANQEYVVKSLDEIKCTVRDINKNISEIKR